MVGWKALTYGPKHLRLAFAGRSATAGTDLTAVDGKGEFGFLRLRGGAKKYKEGSEKIAVVGSGNFASALVRILGRNAIKHDVFDEEVRMYVYEEMIDGKPLTEIINETHENVKYLKGAKLGPNVVAVPDIAKAVEGATMVVFCLPHQFLKPMVPAIKSAVAKNVKCVSAIKGIDFDEKGIVLISDIIRSELNTDCSILMGANVANDMATDAFCETTIGYKNADNGELFRLAFDDAALKVGTVQDTVGVELCGALKNIVAIGAGFCDGLGYGGNTKAAIIRIGLKEMIKFCKTFYPRAGIQDDTFLQSCGVADLMTTCYGGRNRKCAEAFAAAGKRRTLEEIEKELLGGQKLQGTLTAKEVNHILKMKGMEDDFPFFTTVYKICYEDAPLSAITETSY
jgi:glycerol-3-phosphate dehydrogenase (NAD+)